MSSFIFSRLLNVLNLDHSQHLSVSWCFRTSIGSFQRLRAEASEVILLSQRLALKYNTTPPSHCQHFFPSFLPFFDFLFSQPFSSLSQRLQTVRQSFAASAKAGAAGKVPPALLRSVLRFIMYLYSLQSSGIRYRYSRILHHGIPFPVSSSLCPDFILKNAAQFWLKFRNAKCSGILLDLPLDSDRIELHSVRLDIVCTNGYLLFQEMPVHTVSMEESYEDHQTQRRGGSL